MTIHNKPDAGTPIIMVKDDEGQAALFFQEFIDEIVDLVNDQAALITDLEDRITVLETP